MRLKIPKADNMFVLSLKIWTCFESIGLWGHVKMLVVADHLQNHSLMQSCAIPETAICFIVDCHVFNNETSLFFAFSEIFQLKKQVSTKMPIFCNLHALWLWTAIKRIARDNFFFLKKKWVDSVADWMKS